MKIFRTSIVCLLFIRFTAFAAAGDTPPPIITDDYFCMHAHHNPGFEAVFSDAPHGIFRTWDSGIVWPHIEPQNDTWNWELLDRYVELARANGVEIIFTLGMTPPWAAARPDAPSPYGACCSSSPPRDMADWTDFVTAAARRNKEKYGGAIKYWEVWNEPDNMQPGYEFYTGTVAEMVEMARAARDALMAVDPKNKLVSPGITQAGGEWLDKFIALGGGELVDIVGFHFYWDWYSPNVADYGNAAAAIKRVMENRGVAHKPLWLTETGFSLKNFKSTPKRLAALASMMAAPRYFGADAACAYAWNNGLFTGMYDNDKREATEIHFAYRELHKWLLGAAVTGFSTVEPKVRVFTLERNGAKAWLAWRHAAGEADYAAGAAGGSVFSLDGGSSPIPPDGKIRLSGAPVLIAEEGYFASEKE